MKEHDYYDCLYESWVSDEAKIIIHSLTDYYIVAMMMRLERSIITFTFENGLALTNCSLLIFSYEEDSIVSCSYGLQLTIVKNHLCYIKLFKSRQRRFHPFENSTSQPRQEFRTCWVAS